MKTMSNAKKIALVAAIVLIALVIYTRLTYSPPVRASQQTFNQKLQQGIGALAFPQTSTAVPTAIDSILTFTNDRGGIIGGSALRSRLVTMEQQTLNGQANRLAASQVGSIFTETFFERVSTLTDTDIKTIRDKQKIAPDFVIPERPGDVDLRKVGGRVKGDLWFDKARAYRDSSTAEALAQRAATPGYVSGELNKRLSMYQTASPSQWGDSYTPLQIYVLFYSIVTDDLMEGNTAYLADAMQSAENYFYTKYGIPRSSAGRKAYGLNGYLFSSSTDLFLSDAVLNRLLDRVEAIN